MNDYLNIGIDIGGTAVKAALVDENFQLSEKVNEPSRMDQDYGSFVDHLTDIVNRLKLKAGSEVRGIGIGVAGLMDKECRTVLTSPFCRILIGRHIAEDLAAATDLTVKMENDAVVMAMGEGINGAATGSEHYIVFTIGTGIGGAVVSNGRFIKGVDGGGCELGHIPIDRNGPVCGCGARGCIEAYVGTAGIRRFIRDTVPQFETMEIKDISRIAFEGDLNARKVFTYVGETLAIAAAGLVNTFNPEIIVIGGGISGAGDFIINPMEKELGKRAFKQYLSSLKIRIAELGNWAGVVGAASLVRKENT